MTLARTTDLIDCLAHILKIIGATMNKHVKKYGVFSFVF